MFKYLYQKLGSPFWKDFIGDLERERERETDQSPFYRIINGNVKFVDCYCTQNLSLYLSEQWFAQWTCVQSLKCVQLLVSIYNEI